MEKLGKSHQEMTDFLNKESGVPVLQVSALICATFENADNTGDKMAHLALQMLHLSYENYIVVLMLQQ